MPTALITGITGQDGGYLADSLLDSGWIVHAFVRPLVDGEKAPAPEVISHAGDLRDPTLIQGIIRDVEPDVIFNLGGISSVALSWEQPVLTGEVSALAVATILDAAWTCQEKAGKQVRVVQPSSSEIFGISPQVPQVEETPIRPITPYGAAKAYAHHMISVYRGRGLFASGAILYNHESPNRPPTFVTRKITMAVARISAGLSSNLALGNLDVTRDWGWAPDYVNAMVMMAKAPEPDDYIVATGEGHTVREFVCTAFEAAGIMDWERFVSVSSEFARPSETPIMLGDSSKLRKNLGWSPTKTFDEIVQAMVEHDLSIL